MKINEFAKQARDEFLQEKRDSVERSRKALAAFLKQAGIEDDIHERSNSFQAGNFIFRSDRNGKGVWYVSLATDASSEEFVVANPALLKNALARLVQ